MNGQRPVMRAREITPEDTSGRFNERRLAELLGEVSKGRFSGRLSIKAREGFGTILFREGSIASVATPATKKRLMDGLIEKGVCEHDELEVAERLAEKDPERDVASILIEEGYHKKEAILTVMREVAEEALFSMMFWNGIYRFEGAAAVDIPDTLIIDSGEFLKRMEESLVDIADFKVDGLFMTEAGDGAVSSDAAPGADPKAEIDKTLKDVAKSLTAFKPHEVVIIVEDEAVMRTIMADGLSHFGFSVEGYENARGALDRIIELETATTSPVVIIDIVMEGLFDARDIYGGMDLLNYISQSFPTIPVIIATGVSDPDVRLKTQFLGASYFINKPCEGDAQPDGPGPDIVRFIEEIAYCLETIFRRQQAYLEKEQLASVREELLSQILKKGNVSFRSIDDILRARILVVDDEKGIRDLCEEFLGSEGFTDITVASDGDEAIQRFTERRHDIVITDIVMPKKNGIEILTYVKTLVPNAQVIIITGNADKNTSIAAVKLGAFDYIEKPIDFPVLCETVKKAVEMKLVLDEKI
jgi:CheY-like chemotaxis protein